MTVSGKKHCRVTRCFGGRRVVSVWAIQHGVPSPGQREWKTGVYHAETEVSAANYPRVRLFKVASESSLQAGKRRRC